MRREYVNRSDEYYPMIVKSDLTKQELNNISHSLCDFIYVDPAVFEGYMEYTQKYPKHRNRTTQQIYCSDQWIE